MKSIKNIARFSLIATGVILGGTVATAQSAMADSLELVTNGEFEAGSGTWTVINSIDGWSNGDQIYETWRQGVIYSPAVGTDGFGTGRHLEVNPHSGNFLQSFLTSEDMAGTAKFSFDAWQRGWGQGSYSVVGSLSGILAAGEMDMNRQSWTSNIEEIIFNPGEMITLSFNGRGDGANNPHIDQVSFLADMGGAAAVPEPTTLLGLAAIAGAAALKRKQSAEVV